jgi:phosphatidylinositol alpha 1,6-mannosyltransferase
MRKRHGEGGLAFAKTMDWDEINAAVLRVYERVLRRRGA